MDASSLRWVALVLSRTFARPQARAFLVEYEFPDSVLRIFDRATADPGWAFAQGWAERAYIVLRVIETDASIRAVFEADHDAGRLGLGAGDDEEFDRELGRLDGLVYSAGGELPVGDGLLGGEDLPDGGSGGIVVVGDVIGSVGDWGGLVGIPPVAPTTPGPEAPAPGPQPEAGEAEVAEPEVVETWLSAKLDGVDTSAPLQVAEEYVLALSFGPKLTGVAAALATLTFPSESDHLDLTIRLFSAEFETPPLPQSIRVRRDGTSAGRALFPITPRKAGPAVLTAMVDFQGNFVQQLVLTFDVGGAPAADVDVTSLGRPVAAATVLEPREASMRFTPAVGGYKLVVPGVTADEVFVQVTADQLAAAIEQVRSVLLSIVRNESFALAMDIPAELGARALELLAFAGYRLYQQIFEGPFASPELRGVGAWLRDTLSRDVTTLQVVSSGFPVPWALVYLTERWDESKLDWGNFIGMRHVVEQVPMREITVAPPSSTIDPGPALAVRVLYNDGIDAQMPSHPVAAQRAYWQGRSGLALLEGTSAAELFDDALVPDSTDKVLYLYCHAVSSNTNPDDSHLVLTGDERVTLGRLSAKAPTGDLLTSHPLVFINACESGDLSPNFYDGFVPYFLGKGARGVIGTECKTPGYFASEWAKAFFDRFFAGERVGDAVLALRRQFLAEHGNPLGLLYGVYCDTDTRIAPALTTGASG